MIVRFLKWIFGRREKPIQFFDRSNDPVYSCDVYRDKPNGSCAHVDGPLCEMATCNILKDYREDRKGVPVLKASEDDPLIHQYRFFDLTDDSGALCPSWGEWKTCDVHELKEIREYIRTGHKYQIRTLRESQVEGFAPSRELIAEMQDRGVFI